MAESKWVHFTEEELTCHCGCGRQEMDNEFMEKLVGMRLAMDRPFIVTSAYRCPDYNARISRTGTAGPHTTGRAVDIAMSGQSAYNLVELAYKMGITGIGLKQTGPHQGRFVHLDDLEGGTRPWVWTY